MDAYECVGDCSDVLLLQQRCYVLLRRRSHDILDLPVDFSGWLLVVYSDKTVPDAR